MSKTMTRQPNILTGMDIREIEKRVVARKSELKLTWENIAERIGVDYSTVINWVKGRRSMTCQDVESLANALNMPVIYLMFGVGLDRVYSEDTNAFADIYDRLPPAKKSVAKTVAHSLFESSDQSESIVSNS